MLSLSRCWGAFTVQRRQLKRTSVVISRHFSIASEPVRLKANPIARRYSASSCNGGSKACEGADAEGIFLTQTCRLETGLPGWACKIRTGESVGELSDWNSVTTSF